MDNMIKDTSFELKGKTSLPMRMFKIGKYLFRLTAIKLFKLYIPYKIEYLKKIK